MPLATSKLLPASALALSAALVAAGPARADLVVNEDLGTFGFGTVSRSGTTLGGANNAANYLNANDALSWAGEFVYRFTTTRGGRLELATTDVNGANGVDNDFFLLTGLTTGPNPGGVSPEAKDVFGGAFAQVVTDAADYGFVDAGTYFLSVDSFGGAEGAFSLELALSEFVAPAAEMAGLGGMLDAVLGAGEVLFYEFEFDGVAGRMIDTFGSTVDTELGLFDADGALLGTNDDAGGGSQSELSLDDFGLIDGETYYLAAAAFNTAFEDGFGATSFSNETGLLTINGLQVAPVPEPGTFGLIGAAALGLLARRRRQGSAVV